MYPLINNLRCSRGENVSLNENYSVDGADKKRISTDYGLVVRHVLR